MDYIVKPANLKGGTVRVPGDKSISHRALMLAAIAEGDSTIRNFLNGSDCLATAGALEAMGVAIERDEPTSLVVHGVGLHGLRAASGPLDLGNSGTGMRLLAGLLCGQPFDSVLTGDASLSRRPMDRVIEPLARMGAQIGSQDGFPPLGINGGQRLSGIHYSMPVASAQVKSSILLASLYARGRCSVVEPAATRDHTERLLRAMAVDLQGGEGHVAIQGGQSPKACNVDVPGDLSSAAFPVLAALLAENCELLIEQVGVNPTRTGVIRILRDMGGSIELENASLAGEEPVADLRVRSSRLHGIDVDPSLVSLAIDEFPVLFIAAALASGTTRFAGIGELRVKESDRITTMSAGLRELGIAVTETADGATVQGGGFGAGSVDSAGDHRVAMAFAVGAARASGAVTICRVDNVGTSFPGFPGLLRGLGADLEETAEGAR